MLDEIAQEQRIMLKKVIEMHLFMYHMTIV
jgi:hypothetical protein